MRVIAQSAGSAAITQTTDTLANIELLTPALGDQGDPSDDRRTLVCKSAATWTYLQEWETLLDADFENVLAAYDFLNDGPAGDGVHTVPGWGTVTVAGTANYDTVQVIPGTGLKVQETGAAAGNLTMTVDWNQFATLNATDVYRYLFLTDTTGTVFGTNGQAINNNLLTVGYSGLAHEMGFDAVHVRVAGSWKMRVASFMAGANNSYDETVKKEWMEIIMWPRSAHAYRDDDTFGGAIPDLGDLTTHSADHFSEEDSAGEPWGAGGPLEQVTIFQSQGAAYTAIIKRMVCQRVLGV